MSVCNTSKVLDMKKFFPTPTSAPDTVQTPDNM